MRGAPVRFALRVAATRAHRLLVIALIAAVTVGAVAGTAAWALGRFDDGARAILSAADPEARSVVVHASRLAGDDAIDPIVADTRAEAFAGLPVDTVTRLTLPIPCPPKATCTLGGVTLVADPAAHAAADLVEGAWPLRRDEAAITEAAAARHSLATGDVISVGAVTVRIVGVWKAKDPTATLWLSDPGVASGGSSAMVSPVLVTDDTILATGSTAETTWAMSPAALTATNAGSYADAVRRLPDLLAAADPERLHSLRLTGALGDTLDRVVTATAAASGAVAVPLIVAGLLGAIVLWLAVASLQRSRRSDHALLRARGASTRRIIVTAGGECAVFAGVGGIVAVAASVVVAGVGALVPAVLVAVAITVIAFVAAGWGALEAARAQPARADVGRMSVLALAVPALVLAVAAGLATAQLLTRRSLELDGRLDVAAAAAPALLLAAVALIAPLLAMPLAALAQRLARNTAGVLPVLPLRRIARRSGALTAGVLCLALAAGAGVLGGAIVGAGQHAQHRAVHDALGADVRVRFAQEGDLARRMAAVTAAGGVTAAAPALVTDVTLGAATPTLVAAPTSMLGEAAPFGDQLNTAARPTPTDGPVSVSFVAVDHAAVEGTLVDEFGQLVTIPMPAAEISATVWVLLADGEVKALTVPPLTAEDAQGRGAEQTVQVEVPAGAAVLALGVRASSPNTTPDVRGSVRLTAGTTTLIESELALSGQGEQRFLVDSLPTVLPVVVTRALSEELAIQAGSTLTLSSGTVSRSLPIVVVAVVESLPTAGARAALAADLGTLREVVVSAQGSEIAPLEVWAVAPDGDAAARSIRAALDERAVILSPRAVSNAPIGDVAVGAVLIATAGVLLLAIAGFAGVASESTRARMAERVPLRAVGVTGAMQRRADTLELALVAVFALAIGAASGIVVAMLVAPIVEGMIA